MPVALPWGVLVNSGALDHRNDICIVVRFQVSVRLSVRLSLRIRGKALVLGCISS